MSLYISKDISAAAFCKPFKQFRFQYGTGSIGSTTSVTSATVASRDKTDGSPRQPVAHLMYHAYMSSARAAAMAH